jgi:hypothetical protein
MPRSKTAVAAALLTLMALVLPLAVAPVAAGDSAARIKAEHQRIVNYWTAERIKNAKPRDFIRTPDGTFEPKTKPVKPPPGGGGRVTGASWTGGGTVVQRTGKVLFTMDGGNWVCSAAAVTDGRSDYSLIMTAGHCAYVEVNRAFATNWTYVPSFDTAPTFTCAQSTYGCWTTAGGGLVVHNGFATAGSFNTQATVHDFAIAIVPKGGKDGNTQLDSLGSYAIGYPAISTGGTVHAFGYPAAGKYHGNDLTYCTGPTFNDVYNANQTWGINCDMTGGSSGGPWIAAFTSTNPANPPTLTSLNSYGYNGLSNMYGPKFNSDTQAVWTRADSSSSNQLVP